jgi:hypothetical protein
MKYAFVPVILSISLLAGCAQESEVQCTTAAKETWQTEQSFQDALVAKGYAIDQFKVTPGNCYEIYGKNPQQEKVEIYFNPVDGNVVKEEKK